MTPAEIKLKEALAIGYRAIVLHQTTIESAFATFNRVASDPDVMDAAKAELKRSSKFDSKRCFVSSSNARFLKQAIENFIPMHQTPIPDNTFGPIVQTQGQEDMTSKLKALASLAKTTVAQVEIDAEAAIGKLQAAQVKAQGGVAKINSVASEIEDSAGALEDFANQITNGGPPLA